MYQNHYGVSFTDSLTKMPGSGIQTKPTSSEKKMKKRKLQRDCCDHISSQMQKTDAFTVLAGQSIASYKRMRLSCTIIFYTYKSNKQNAHPILMSTGTKKICYTHTSKLPNRRKNQLDTNSKLAQENGSQSWTVKEWA